MKKITLVLLFFLFFSNIYSQNVSATYTAGDISTGDLACDPACNGPLTTLVVNVPVVANVTSVDV